jgi:hypothetical protein
MARASPIMSPMDGQRQTRIQELRELVARGEYRVDPRAVAAAVIRRQLGLDLDWRDDLQPASGVVAGGRSAAPAPARPPTPTARPHRVKMGIVAALTPSVTAVREAGVRRPRPRAFGSS